MPPKKKTEKKRSKPRSFKDADLSQARFENCNLAQSQWEDYSG